MRIKTLFPLCQLESSSRVEIYFEFDLVFISFFQFISQSQYSVFIVTSINIFKYYSKDPIEQFFFHSELIE